MASGAQQWEVAMKIGMLWCDTDGASLALDQRVARAASYYRRKYGSQPNLCLVHPEPGAESLQCVGSTSVRINPSVLPGHLWLGIEDERAD
jgi:hypothetical protein